MLKRHYIWDILEINWKEVKVTLNGNKINFPNSVILKFRYKFKIRQYIDGDPLLLHIMLKQGGTCFSLASDAENEREISEIPHNRGEAITQNIA